MNLIRLAYALIALTLGGLSAYDFSRPAYGAEDQRSIADMAIKLGFSAERLQRLATGLDRKIAEKAWPGSVTLIAREGHLVHFEAHGALDQAGNIPMPTNAIFRIMSMTKPIVSVTAMALWEQGLFNLDDPIDRIFLNSRC